MFMNPTHPHDALDEHDLMSAVATGDEPAFARLYRTYEKRVFQYVRSLVGDSVLAEEIVGDTMIAVWRSASSYSGSSRLSTWIFGIARHKALDAMRRTKRQGREVDLDGAMELPAPGDNPLECTQRQEMCELTQRAMASLSAEHREVLRLTFYEELPYEDISRLLSIPVNTVKTRVFYAKQQLKRQLERLEHTEPTP